MLPLADAVGRPLPSRDAVAVLQPMPRSTSEPTGAGNGVVGWAH